MVRDRQEAFNEKIRRAKAAAVEALALGLPVRMGAHPREAVHPPAALTLALKALLSLGDLR